MAGWKTVKLGEVCYKITDGSHNPPKGQESATDFLMLSSKNINDNALTFHGARYLSESDFLSENKRTDVNVGDVLLTIVGTVGRSVVVVEKHAKFTLQRSVAVIKPTDALDSFFLSYVLGSTASQREMQQKAKGVAQKGIYLKEVKSLSIPLPPLEEQRRIVEILDAAQALIDQRKEQLALMDQLVQSLFYTMFGDPVTNPMGWKKTTIGETCNMVKDGPHKSLDYSNDGIPFVSVKDIIKGRWDFSNVRYISNELFEEHRKRCQPQFGDVLYTKGGTTGFAKLVDIKIDFLNWVHIAVLKFPRDQVDGKFYEAMLNTIFCYAQSQRYTRGIANRDLVLGEMKKIKHYLPPYSLQAKFASRVEKIETQKSAMTASLSELEDTFNALMQRAFKAELQGET